MTIGLRLTHCDILQVWAGRRVDSTTNVLLLGSRAVTVDWIESWGWWDRSIGRHKGDFADGVVRNQRYVNQSYSERML